MGIDTRPPNYRTKSLKQLVVEAERDELHKREVVYQFGAGKRKFLSTDRDTSANSIYKAT